MARRRSPGGRFNPDAMNNINRVLGIMLQDQLLNKRMIQQDELISGRMAEDDVRQLANQRTLAEEQREFNLENNNANRTTQLEVLARSNPAIAQQMARQGITGLGTANIADLLPTESDMGAEASKLIAETTESTKMPAIEDIIGARRAAGPIEDLGGITGLLQQRGAKKEALVDAETVARANEEATYRTKQQIEAANAPVEFVRQGPNGAEVVIGTQGEYKGVHPGYEPLSSFGPPMQFVPTAIPGPGGASVAGVVPVDPRNPPAFVRAPQAASVQEKERSLRNILSMSQQIRKQLPGNEAILGRLDSKLTDIATMLPKEGAISGPIRKRLEQQIGQEIGPRAFDFLKTYNNMLGIIGHERYAGALTPQEIDRLERAIPRLVSQPDQFVSDIDSFDRMIEDEINLILQQRGETPPPSAADRLRGR